jgi:hypothetical protein
LHEERITWNRECLVLESFNESSFDFSTSS